MGSQYIGELEQMVLLSILNLEDEAYGMRVMADLKSRVGRTVSRGAMYVILDRLEGKGLIESQLADPTPERGGRGKRFLQVTVEGLEALRRSRDALNALWKGVTPLLDPQS